MIGARSGDLKSEVAVVEGGGDNLMNCKNARFKAEIISHPLYEQLLSAHVACLRIATPVDQFPKIDAKLAQFQNMLAKYSAFPNRRERAVISSANPKTHFPQYDFHFLFSISKEKEKGASALNLISSVHFTFVYFLFP
ncbi:hypothetical protein VIGAN_09049100, partial [Vigna angularis var. angularis]